jgi:hypothetical protein
VFEQCNFQQGLRIEELNDFAQDIQDRQPCRYYVQVSLHILSQSNWLDFVFIHTPDQSHVGSNNRKPLSINDITLRSLGNSQ